MKNKPEVGQTVWSLNIGNAAYNRDQSLTKYVVTKVGRKYFHAKRDDDASGWSETKYNLDSWVECTNYSPDSRLYVKEQEWLDEKEYERLCRIIGDAFHYGRCTKSVPLESLQKIVDILNGEI